MTENSKNIFKIVVSASETDVVLQNEKFVSKLTRPDYRKLK